MYLTSVTSLIIPVVSQHPADVIRRFIGERDGLSRDIAEFIMGIVNWILGIFGLNHDSDLVTVIYAAVVLGIAIVVGIACQWLILKVAQMIARRWNATTYQALTRQRFFHKICRLVPPLVFLALIEFTLANHNSLAGTLTKITLCYIVFVICHAVNAVIMALWHSINVRANKRRLPLGGIAQLAKGIVWIIGAIIIIAVLVDKSPARLLTGLGAFSAVLMLIFKSDILSLVAGIQLSENDSLHVGDWIEVPGTKANGTVQEVSLVAVKVLNWDKTTTTLPPYSLISTGFTNYRTMQESNTRRICRSYMIDADSVLPSTQAMLDNIRRVPMMDDYITRKLQQKAAGHVADVDNPEGLVDGSLDTNLGLFRAYLKMWLDANPHISHDSDCFVSTLAQTPTGIPLQVYCFTATSRWFPYEGIQDLVFEHIAAMLPQFQLYTFENPSGRDTIVDGYLSPGGDIDKVYGIPYPFFQASDAPDSPASTRRDTSPAVPSSASKLPQSESSHKDSEPDNKNKI